MPQNPETIIELKIMKNKAKQTKHIKIQEKKTDQKSIGKIGKRDEQIILNDIKNDP